MSFNSITNDESITKAEQSEWEFRGVLLEMTSVLQNEEEDLSHHTQSTVDGLSSEDEYALRIFGCELIQTSGQLLKLPQVAMATAQILFQRFFRTKSFVRHNYEHHAMACIHLAAKIEECPRRIRDTINVFNHIRQAREKKPFIPLIPDQAYVNMKNHVVKAERRVLKELGFCVHVKHPHKLIVCFLQFLGVERNRLLVQCAWNLMNDSLRTSVFVRFYPETIACACIYLAARQLGVRLPEKPGEPMNWWELLQVKESSIRTICLDILYLYSLAKPEVERLEGRVTELIKLRRREIDKKQSEREKAAAAAVKLVEQKQKERERKQAFSIVPGGLVMRHQPLGGSDEEEEERRNGRVDEERRRRFSPVDDRLGKERSSRRSPEGHRKHRERRGRHGRRSRTPKAYRRVPSRSPIRYPTKTDRLARASRKTVRHRSHSSASRSSSGRGRLRPQTTTSRHYRSSKNDNTRRRRQRRSITRSTSSSSSSSTSSSNSGRGRGTRAVVKRDAGPSSATVNGNRKKVRRDKDKH